MNDLNTIKFVVAGISLICAVLADKIDDSKEGAYLFMCTAFICICLIN